MIDSTKWSEIYKKHSGKMLWVCKRYVTDASLAEDLMHEGFITAMQKQHTFSGFGSFEGWLRTIMVNTSLIYLRKNKERFLVSDSEVPDNTIATADMNATYDIKSKIINTDFTQQELLDVVDAIPEHHRIVFNMYVIDKFSHREISKTLNISTNTSKSHLLRARKKIQELLLVKSNEREEGKDRKRLFFWWLFFFSGYVDSLYANGYSSFDGTPSKPFDINAALQQQQMPQQITSGFIFGMTLQKFTVGVSGALLILVSLFFIDFTNEKASGENQRLFEGTSNNASGKGSTGNHPPNDSLKIPGNRTAKDVLISKADGNPGKSDSVNKTGPEPPEAADKSKIQQHKKKRNKNVVIKKIIDTIYVYE